MTNNVKRKKLVSFTVTYGKMARAELAERWQKWKLDLTETEVHEVVGALLARQISLATQMAEAPSIWNGHIAPMVLRTMADTHITLAWILCAPVDRARKYVYYGLGQEKLNMEHRKAQLTSQGTNPDEDPIIKATEGWINSQQYTFLTEVNIGSWTGIGTRDMADKANCLDLYNYAYVPFSAATHSMWHHISKYNLVPCENPLHGYHRIPVVPDNPFADVDYFYNAAKYLAESFELFDKIFEMKVTAPSAFTSLVLILQEISAENDGTRVKRWKRIAVSWLKNLAKFL
jgi:hypothetical protein